MNNNAGPEPLARPGPLTDLGRSIGVKTKSIPAGLPAGLVGEVSALMVRHGYPEPDAADLFKALHTFLYADRAPAVDEPRCPDPECGEPLALIESGAVGHCGRSCAGEQDLADEPRRENSPAGRDAEYATQSVGALAAVATTGPPADPLPAVDVEAAVRRTLRWQLVAGAIATAAVAPPREVRISDDGWSVELRVSDEAQVRAWGDVLGIADTLAARIYTPRRGVVQREVSVRQAHPWQVVVSYVEDVAAPRLGDRALAAAVFRTAGDRS